MGSATLLGRELSTVDLFSPCPFCILPLPPPTGVPVPKPNSCLHVDKDFFFLLFRAAPVAFMEVPMQMGATDAGLCHSHSNTRSELHLQLEATPD